MHRVLAIAVGDQVFDVRQRMLHAACKNMRRLFALAFVRGGQGVFRSFLTRIKHIDPDVNAALAELKSAIDNEVWREWCEALSACQYDHSMKSTLNPIVAKLSDMRIINGELENLVFAPRKEFISMAALVVLNIPLLYFLNKDWYAALMTTVPGKAVLAVCAAAIFLSFARVVKLTQPIEYRR